MKRPAVYAAGFFVIEAQSQCFVIASEAQQSRVKKEGWTAASLRSSHAANKLAAQSRHAASVFSTILTKYDVPYTIASSLKL